MQKAIKFWRVAFYGFAILSLTSMAGMSIGATLLSLGFFAYLFYASPAERARFLKYFWQGSLGKTTLLFVLVAIASQVAGNIWPPLQLPYTGRSIIDLKKFHHFIYPFIIAYSWSVLEPNLAKAKFWYFWFGTALVIGTLSILQFFGGYFFPLEFLASRFFRPIGETGFFHGQGLMFFHLSFASVMCFTSLAAWSKIIWREKGEVFLPWLALALVLSLGAFFSFSRTVWFALPVGFCVILFMRKPKWGLVGILCAVLLAVVVWNSSESVRQRVSDNKAGLNERFIVWLASWEMFRDRPISGVGFARTGFYSSSYGAIVVGAKPEFSSHAHNNIVDIVAGMGFLGFMAFLLWWEEIFRNSFRALKQLPPKEKWIPAAAIGSFVAFHVNGLTQVNFWDGKTMHTLMLWVAIVHFMAREKIQKT